MMVDFLPFLKILPIFSVALLSPGPDFMLVSNLSLSRGRLAGIQGAAGIAAGVMLYTLLALWGLGALFLHMAWVMMAVKIIGGLYLCYLGLMMWRSSFKRTTVAQAIPVKSNEKSAFLLGLLTNLTNPKAMAFFASVFALALTPDTTTETKIVTMLLCAAMPLLWFSFVALALSKPAVRMQYQKWQQFIDRVAGSIVILFGLKLVLSGRD